MVKCHVIFSFIVRPSNDDSYESFSSDFPFPIDMDVYDVKELRSKVEKVAKNHNSNFSVVEITDEEGVVVSKKIPQCVYVQLKRRNSCEIQ